MQKLIVACFCAAHGRLAGVLLCGCMAATAGDAITLSHTRTHQICQHSKYLHEHIMLSVARTDGRRCMRPELACVRISFRVSINSLALRRSTYAIAFPFIHHHLCSANCVCFTYFVYFFHFSAPPSSQVTCFAASNLYISEVFVLSSLCHAHHRRNEVLIQFCTFREANCFRKIKY